MHFKIVSIVSIFCSCLTNAFETGTSFRDAISWPYNLKTNFPFPTYSPMRIDTSSARAINSSTQLKIAIPLHKKMQVTNTGQTVIAKLQEPAKEFTMSGGILGSEVYEFDNVFFKWTQDRLEYTAAKVDEVGAPIIGVTTFYNRRYKSLNYAKEQRDGIVLFVVKIVVQGMLPNKEFSKFEAALRLVTIADSKTETTVDAATSFFGLYPEPAYYAYPGSYYVTSNEKQLFSATIIELSKSHYPSISIAQFSAFTNLKNHNQMPIDARLTSYAPDSRPLVQGNGIIHEPIQ